MIEEDELIDSGPRFDKTQQQEKFMTKSWLFLPSPYLVAPSPIEIDPDVCITLVLDRLTDKNVNQRLAGDETGKILLQYFQFVTGEFLRKFINPDFPYWKPKKDVAGTIALEVNLWKAVLTLLEEMYAHKPFMRNPAAVFYALISERMLIAFVATTSHKPTVAKEYIRNLQSQNRKLQNFENPFDPIKTPWAWEVVDQAIGLAGLNDQFRQNCYMPFVQARQKMATRMKEDRVRVYRHGKLQRQGRRKEA